VGKAVPSKKSSSKGAGGTRDARAARPAPKAAAAKPSKASSAAKASAGKTAPRPVAARAGASAAPAKGKLVAAVSRAAPAVKGKPAPQPESRKDARANRAQKPVRIETKPDRPVAAPTPPPVRVEQVSSSGDSKPKRNQAGLSPKELDFFRDLLLSKRRELIGDMNSMEHEALQSSESNLSTLPIHMADMGTDNYEQEFTLGLVEKDRLLLREINHALAKMQNGSYGVCEGNGQPISKVRLEAQPWARHSIEFVRSQEKRSGGIR